MSFRLVSKSVTVNDLERRNGRLCVISATSEADFEVFRPAGATRCTDGRWNLAWFRPLLHAKFHLSSVQR